MMPSDVLHEMYLERTESHCFEWTKVLLINIQLVTGVIETKEK